MKFKMMVFFLTLFRLSPVQADGVSATLKGDWVQWLDSKIKGEYLFPNNWQSFPNLPITSEWIPGTFISPTPQKVTLHHKNGSFVTFAFRAVGTQFDKGYLSSIFPKRGKVPDWIQRCPVQNSQTSRSFLVGQQCIFDHSYQTNSSDVKKIPFLRGRPIFQVESTDIVEAFHQRTLPKGVYKGEVQIDPAYMYREKEGNWSYRSATNMYVPVTLHYYPPNS